MTRTIHRTSLPYRFRQIVAVSVGALFFCLSLSANAQQKLKIFTWSEYMDPDVVTEFEEEFNTRVVFSYFQSDQARDEELAVVAGRGYDLLLVNSTQIERYGKRGWLEPIDWTSIPNAVHVDRTWMQAFSGVETYAMPYFGGSMGIAYRKDLVPKGFESWLDLFKPEEVLRDRIIMINDSRELVGLAMKASGHSANSGNHAHIAEARELLLAQRPYVNQYAYPTLDEDSALLTGEVWAASMYSGDVLMLQEQSDNIAYSIPQEGGLMWIDYFTVAQSSANKALAHQFLDFINRPEIAARLADWVFYATPNMAAVELMSEDYTSNSIIHPDTEQMENSEYIQAMPPRARKKVNSIGAELFREIYSN